MRSPKILCMVLAGGEGKRLMPLTSQRAKPAVPFGGIYRLIDFALSNLANSGYLHMVVLTQYKSHSLDRHISKTWRLSTLLGNYVAQVPAQQRVGKRWYQGSADAIFQCLNIIHEEKPDYIVVVGADHVYRMDFSQMVKAHIDSGASITVSAIRQPIALAHQFGVIETDENDPTRIKEFREKPQDPVGLPNSPEEVFASMGNYVFTTKALIEAVTKDSENEDSKHDVGGDIVPYFVDRAEAAVYDFGLNHVPGGTERDMDYWRDVGTIDSYYDANRDLISVNPIFNMYNEHWPVYAGRTNLAPAKFVHGGPGRIGHAVDSIVSPGVIISGATVTGSVLSPGVEAHSWATINESVLLDGVHVSRHAQLNRVILDKDVVVKERARVGLDPEHDRSRGFTVTDTGITVVPKGFIIED